MIAVWRDTLTDGFLGSLLCLFTSKVERGNSSYSLEILHPVCRVKHTIPLWGSSIGAVLVISTGVALPSSSVSVVEALIDKMGFGLGIGVIGTGIIAAVRHQAEKSVKHIILLGGGLFCLSTIVGALTIPSLTFFPILQLLFFGGIIATALLPYGLLRRKPHPTSPEPA